MHTRQQLIVLIIGLMASLASGCSHPRVFVATGTLVGLEATPGDLNEGQVPGVTFGYRRGEIAIIPVADKDKDHIAQNTSPRRDAASTLTAFNLANNWFGPTWIEQYVATGHASREIITGGQFALLLAGYEKGTDDLADRFAKAYKASVKKDATSSDKQCWESVKSWMSDKFPGLPATDIVTKSFSKQRPTAAVDSAIKTACNLS